MGRLKIFSWYSFIALGLLTVLLFKSYQFINPDTPNWVTAQVERGTVSEVVAVSGFIESLKTAYLSFPGTGLITGVMVKEGEKVEPGQVLATLAVSQLVAERSEATSNLAAAEAAYQKTLSGPRNESLTLAETSIRNAQENLDNVIKEEERKVKNAKTTLLSSGLSAVATSPTEKGIPPTITGTYNCETEGKYTLSIYRSNSKSGYSYKLEGLENGTFDVSVEQPAALGTCGLYTLFSPNVIYTDSNWEVEIPNTRSTNYTTFKNSYDLAVTQASNAIAAARSRLDLVIDEATFNTAPARSEELNQAAAVVEQAEARIKTIDAKLADRSILAPFAGVVIDVAVTEGESAQGNPAITLLAEDAFQLKARVPEIDITKISEGQSVKATFDARSNEPLSGKIIYVSPSATQIDGVAYFEVTINLNDKPSWLRAGLNADVDITTKAREDVLRLPKRFVTTNSDGKSYVIRPLGTKSATTTIEVLFVGNDSFLEITGLEEGEIVIAP